MSYESMLRTGKRNATTVTIKREVETADGYGGYTTSTAVLYRRVPCRFNELNEKDIALLWDKQAVLANCVVYLEYVGGLQEDDMLIRDSDSREFNIKLVQDWDADRQMLRLTVLEQGRLE